MVEGEYAECLSMLMRYPPVSDPTLCVEQAKFFRSNVSEAACLQILQQMDAKAGKPPRDSLRPTEMANARQQQRRGPQRAGPVDPISKLTKDMMQNPQIRDINRALVGVMGAVQVRRKDSKVRGCMHTYGLNWSDLEKRQHVWRKCFGSFCQRRTAAEG